MHLFSFFRRNKAKENINNLDQQLVFHLSKSRIPSLKQLKYLRTYLSSKEKLLLNFCLVLVLVSLGYLGIKTYLNATELIPKNGGRYTEGIVGNPQYINPLYSPLNPTDADLERLMFSRLFTTNENGATIPELASSLEVSEDEKTYTITLKNALWHTGDALTADDVVFTFERIQDPSYHSPLRNRFAGVSIEKLEDNKVAFTLREPFGRFPSLLNFGIMPKIIWESTNPETVTLAEYNIKPIGSGPYRFKVLTKTKSGTIRSYTLERNPDYYEQSPYINEIVFKFFPSGQEMVAALNNGQINGVASLPPELRNSLIAPNTLTTQTIALPELTGVFFNTKSAAPSGQSLVRRALRMAIPRETILNNLSDETYGLTATGPLPPYYPGARFDSGEDRQRVEEILKEDGWIAVEIKGEGNEQEGTEGIEEEQTKETSSPTTDKQPEREGNAEVEEEEQEEDKSSDSSTQTPQTIPEKDRLGEGRWLVKGDKALIVRLVAPENLKKAAEEVAMAWESLGIKTEITLRSEEVIKETIIPNRQFDALLITQSLPGGDIYPLWHSAAAVQLTGLSNETIDTLLEEARLTGHIEAMAERYGKLQDIFEEEAPLIPLYWQAHGYLQPKKLKGFNRNFMLGRADRFNQITNWHLNQKRIRRLAD